MSERTTRKLDFATGEVTEQRTRTTAESLQERWRGLIDSTREQAGDVLAGFLGVACDGCGMVAQVERPELPAGGSRTRAASSALTVLPGACPVPGLDASMAQRRRRPSPLRKTGHDPPRPARRDGP